MLHAWLRWPSAIQARETSGIYAWIGRSVDRCLCVCLPLALSQNTLNTCWLNHRKLGTQRTNDDTILYLCVVAAVTSLLCVLLSTFDFDVKVVEWKFQCFMSHNKRMWRIFGKRLNWCLPKPDSTGWKRHCLKSTLLMMFSGFEALRYKQKEERTNQIERNCGMGNQFMNLHKFSYRSIDAEHCRPSTKHNSQI